jgi:hypothetical protein
MGDVLLLTACKSYDKSINHKHFCWRKWVRASDNGVVYLIMSWRIRYALAATLCLFGIAAVDASAATRLAGITSSSKYLQYYGSDFSSNNLQTIKQFDVVVLDPNVSALTPAVVAYLQSNGVKDVLGYISIGEQMPGTPVLQGNGDGPVYATTNGTSTVIYESNNVASFYVDQTWSNTVYVSQKNGQVDRNGTFGGAYVWPNSDWRWVLNTQRIGGVPATSLSNMFIAGLAQIAGARTSNTDANRTHNFGMDGFFLDTLDTAGPFTGVGSYPWAAPEMQNTIKFIHDSYTNKAIFANRGVFFYNPLLVNSQFNIQPYAYTVRPYIHAGLFESYLLDSSSCDAGLSSYVNDDKYDYARKVCAEANRPDGFTMFSLDYQLSRGTSLYELAMNETVVSNGWVEYLCPDGSLATIGNYALNHPRATDTSPPVWDSTANPGIAGGNISCPNTNSLSVNPTPARVGVQALTVATNSNDVTVHWDIALDQTPPVKYNIYQSSDPSFATSVAYSNVVFDIGDGWSTDPVNSFANQYTIHGLTSGTYYFRVRAQDSSVGAFEDTNTVTLSINVGDIYNAIATGGVVLDGNLSDWNPLNSFGAAAQTFITTTTNPVEMAQLWMAHDTTNFYVAYQNYGPTTNGLNVAYNLYLDTDGARSTGFRGSANNFPIGAEYLLQGNTLYRYSGAGTDWNWRQVGVATSATASSNVEFSLPQSWVGNPSVMNLFFLGDNMALPGGAIEDSYPNGALQTGGGGPYATYKIKDVANSLPPSAVTVNGDLSDWTALRSFGVDPQDFPVDSTNQIDLAQIWMAHDAANFFVAYQNYGPIPSNSLGWGYSLYLDIDSSRTTGFRGSADDFPIGADYMLQGNTIYQYTGTNGTDWSWSFVGSPTWAVGSSNAEFSIPRVWIGNPSLVKLFFWGDNTAFGGSAEDLYPENALNTGGGGGYLTYRVADVSNPLNTGSIVVNGNLSDWSLLIPFGQASQDFLTSSTNPVDLAQLRVAHNATNLFVAYQNYGPTTNGLNGAYNLYLDTDNSRATGFRGGSDNFPIGADYLLQGNTVYHYVGGGTDWNWVQVAVATSVVGGTSNVEFSLPQALIGNPSVIGLFFLGDNPSIGGNGLDVYPNSALQAGGGGAKFTYRLLAASQSADSVGDGIPDSWRQAYFGGNGSTTNSKSCATCDPDGDGMSNLQEFLAGTNPTNPASAFRVTNVSQNGANIRVTWTSGAGKTNVLQAAPNISGTYSNVSPNIVLTGTGDSSTNYVDIGGATNSPGRYYRVRLVP